MTVTFKCYGESDDLCEIDGDYYDELTSSYGSRYLRINRKGDKEEGFIIVYRYEINGCWSIAPMMLDENTPLPEWVSFKIEMICEYYRYGIELECTLSGEIEDYEYAWLDNELREERE